MKTLILIILSPLLMINYGYCQQSTFLKRIGGNYECYPLGTYTTLDGGFVTTLSLWEPNITQFNFGIIKHDNNGNLQWSKNYSSQNNYLYPLASNQTNDSCYVVTGAHLDLANPLDESVILIKLDKDGNALWSKSYDGTMKMRGNAVVQTNDNGFLISTYFIEPNSSPPSKDIGLIRTDSSGNVLWSKIMHAVTDDIISKLTLTPNSGFYMTGASSINGASKAIAIKLNSVGDTVRVKTYGSPGQLVRYPMHLSSSDGGHIISATVTGVENKILLLKTDSLGNILWSKEITSNAGGDVVFDVLKLPSGQINMVGNIFINNDFAPVAVKTDSIGNVLWARSYEQYFGAGFVSANFTLDYGLIFSGGMDVLPLVIPSNTMIVKVDSIGQGGCSDSAITYSSTSITLQTQSPSFTIQQDTIITTNLNLVLVNNIFDTTMCITTSAIEINQKKFASFVYPNPTNGNFTINYDLASNTSITLEVFDIMGKCVYNTTLVAGSNTKQVNLNSIANGLYVCKVGNDVVRLLKE